MGNFPSHDVVEVRNDKSARSTHIDRLLGGVMASIRRRLLSLFLLFPLCAFALEVLTRFDIPAQSLPEALRLYAHQAKMQLAYKSGSISGGMSNAVVGEY